MNSARIIIAGIVALIAASIIIGAILLLGGLFPKTETVTEPLSNLPVVSISVSPVPSVSSTQQTPTPNLTATPAVTVGNSTGGSTLDNRYVGENLETYTGDGFSIRYPATWGLLTCSNSKNFELDPTSSQDVLGVVCDRALKPVTFLVKSTNPGCPGNMVYIGDKQVNKSTKTWPDGQIDYRWCYQTGNVWLDVTHRVSQTGDRATSRTDYSTEVEKIIADYQTFSPS